MPIQLAGYLKCKWNQSDIATWTSPDGKMGLGWIRAMLALGPDPQNGSGPVSDFTMARLWASQNWPRSATNTKQMDRIRPRSVIRIWPWSVIQIWGSSGPDPGLVCGAHLAFIHFLSGPHLGLIRIPDSYLKVHCVILSVVHFQHSCCPFTNVGLFNYHSIVWHHANGVKIHWVECKPPPRKLFF